MSESREGGFDSLYDRVYGSLYRYVTGGVKSAELIFLSRRFWPFSFWLKFWSYWGAEMTVPLRSFRFHIRCRGLFTKLTDLYMAATCVCLEQYTTDKAFRIGEEDVVIDIGGHIGSFAVYAGAHAKKGRVLAFEPHPASFRQLQKNVALNGLTNVSMFEQAVAQAPGTRTLYLAKVNSAENNLYKRGRRAHAVDCATLADIFEKNGVRTCDFLKIDCEGAEYEILFNTPKEVLRRIRRMTIEAHVGTFYGMRGVAAGPDELVEFLREAGFAARVWRENELHTFIWAKRR